MTVTATPHEQRRRFARIFFDARATLRVGGADCSAQLLDISLRGALLGVPPGFSVPLGADCAFELCLGEADATIAMQASVAHTEDAGDGQLRIGIRCHEMDIDSITHLRRLVELNLGSDALLHRELAALAAPEHDGPTA